MVFHHVLTGDRQQAVNKANWNAGVDSANIGPQGLTTETVGGQFAPRRNGLLKACRTISSTINSTVSFSFRPDEGLDVMEQIFTQEGVAGQTGVYNEAEASAWGNTVGKVGAIAHERPYRDRNLAMPLGMDPTLIHL